MPIPTLIPIAPTDIYIHAPRRAQHLHALQTQLTTLTQSPVARAEQAHLGISSGRYGRRIAQWMRAGYALLIVSSICISAFMTMLAGQDRTYLMQGTPDFYLSLVQTMIGLVIWALLFTHHAMMSARAIGLGSMAIAREHGLNTWESLTLTHQDARQIVWGKFAGVLGVLWHEQRPLLGWRAGAVGAFGLLLATDTTQHNPSILVIALGMGIAVTLFIVTGIVIAAIGIFVSSFTRSETTATRVGNMALAGLLVGCAAIASVSLFVSFGADGYGGATLFRFFILPLDAGLLTVNEMLLSRYATEDAPAMILNAAVTALAYLGFAALALRAAEYFCVRAGAMRVSGENSS